MPKSYKITDEQVQEFRDQQQAAKIWPINVQYDFTCIQHEETVSKSSENPMIKLRLRCFNKEGDENELMFYLPFNPKPKESDSADAVRKYKWNLIKIKDTCKAFGLEDYYEKHDEIPSDVFLHKKGKLTMKIENWTYDGKSGTRNAIEKLVMPEDQVNADGELNDDIPF